MNFLKNKKYFIKSLIFSLIFTLSLQISIFASNFKEIEGHWAKDSIIRATSFIIQGDENSNVNPDSNISRIEFIKIINKSLDLKSLGKNDSRYLDIGKGKWYDSDVLIAEDYGYINNVYQGNYLSPSTEVTREEAAALLNQARLAKENIDNYKRSNEKLNDDILEAIRYISTKEENDVAKLNFLKGLNFTDKADINRDFLKSVKTLSDEKIINGYEDNSFKPKSPIKKSEAIIIILKSTGNAVEDSKINIATEAPKVENKNEPVEEVKVYKEAENSNYKLNSSNGVYFITDANTGERVKKSQLEKGVVKIGENSYLIKEDGELDSGFVKIGNKTYYADKEKGFIRGWKEIEGSLYYFSPMDRRMYADGVYSTGTNMHWFGKDGKIKTGKRPAGYKGKKSISWQYPTREELTNFWLHGENQELRFRGQEIANYAAKHEGIPFKWYGCDLKDKSGIYCCGAVYSAYKDFGIHVPGPDDCDMYALGGYEMVKAQYTRAEEFGGEYLAADYSKLLPGDITFYYSPKLKQGYNHAAIFLGYNGKTPMIAHATLANGFVVEDAYICTSGWGYKTLKFVRYNTEKNKGSGVIPE